jgi:hypothetical protein
VRYYIPQEDVHGSPGAERHQSLPYKDWRLAMMSSVISSWNCLGYMKPIPECPKIKGLLCFFTNAADIYVDSEPVAAQDKMGAFVSSPAESCALLGRSGLRFNPSYPAPVSKIEDRDRIAETTVKIRRCSSSSRRHLLHGSTDFQGLHGVPWRSGP